MQRRSLWWISALALVAVASLAAVTISAPNLAKTLEAQRRLAVEKPNDPAVFNDLGNLLQLSRRPEEAETAYRRAIELDPNRVSALFNLGLLQQEKGERREAAKLYKRALKIEPRHAWAHYQLGSVYEASGDESKAIDSYAASFALDPQLAFPEVNAQIVDNKLVTQAMLRAYRSDYKPTQAPTMFDDPRRIRPLLVQPVGKEAAQAPAAAQAQVPTPPPPVPGLRNGTATGTAAAKGQQAPGTVLRPQDLQGGATGQAMPPVGGARNPYATGGVRTTVPQPGQPSLREWNRPDPEGSGQPNEGYSEEGIQQGPPQVIPNPGAYYRPGLPSTSRLNLEVIPARARALRGTR